MGGAPPWDTVTLSAHLACTYWWCRRAQTEWGTSLGPRLCHQEPHSCHRLCILVAPTMKVTSQVQTMQAKGRKWKGTTQGGRSYTCLLLKISIQQGMLQNLRSFSNFTIILKIWLKIIAAAATITECLLWARDCESALHGLIILTMILRGREKIMVPFYRWVNWGTKRLSKLPKVMQLRAGSFSIAWMWSPISRISSPLLCNHS